MIIWRNFLTIPHNTVKNESIKSVGDKEPFVALAPPRASFKVILIATFKHIMRRVQSLGFCAVYHRVKELNMFVTFLRRLIMSRSHQNKHEQLLMVSSGLHN